jgi:curved DNA-binding protein CbpA
MEPMNYRRAFKVLEIDEQYADKNRTTIEIVRKQYKMLALKWHPDRNKAPDAAERYREIKDAHDFLMEGSDGSSEPQSYKSVASNFFETLYNNEHFQRRIFHPLLMKVTTLCEEKALAFILRLDADRATKLMKVIETYKTTLHFSDAFFDKVRGHIEGKQTIVLNPNIDDLMQSNVYMLSEGIIAPLWHPLLEYEKQGLIVHCLPELPDNMWIDDDDENTLNVEITETVENIWKMGHLEISIGKEKKRVEMSNLKLKQSQIVELKGEGIPIPHTDNVFYDGDKGLIRVHLVLVSFKN